MVTLSSLLSSNSSEVMVALVRTMLVFDSIYTELHHRGQLSLLHSDSFAEVSTIARPDSVFIYFAPLQVPSTNFSNNYGPKLQTKTHLQRTYYRSSKKIGHTIDQVKRL